MTVTPFETWFGPVAKHPGHTDQKIHGRKGGGSVSIEIHGNGAREVAALVSDTDDEIVQSIIGKRAKYDKIAVARDGQGRIVGAGSFYESRRDREITLTQLRVVDRDQGTGGQIMQTIAQHARSLPSGDRFTMDVVSMISGAEGFYRRMGARPKYDDLPGVPSGPSSHWTADALGRLAAGDYTKSLTIVVKHPGHPDQKVHGRGRGGGEPRFGSVADAEKVLPAGYDRTGAILDGMSDVPTSELVAALRLGSSVTPDVSLDSLSVEDQRALREDAVNKVLKTWEQDSGSGGPLIHCLHLTATERFGLDAKRAGEWDENADDPDNFFGQDVKTRMANHGDTYSRFLGAQSDASQKMFDEAGIDTVTLYRGQRGGGLEGSVTMNPISSWTTDPRRAAMFSVSPTSGMGRERQVSVMRADVPVSRILSTSRTGLGKASENEVTLLGGPIDVTREQARSYAR